MIACRRRNGLLDIDYLVLLVYLRHHDFRDALPPVPRTVKDYFLGARNTSWVVISLSIVATETSTLTLIGVPALAYGIYRAAGAGRHASPTCRSHGYIVGRFIIARLFLPSYFSGEMLTAYELLERRFGAGASHFAASLFLIMRALAEGVRVFAASLVLAAVLAASVPGLPHLWLWSIVHRRCADAGLHLRGRHRRRHLDGSDSVRHLRRRIAAGRVRARASHARRLVGHRRHGVRGGQAAGVLVLVGSQRSLHVLGGSRWAGRS